MNKYIFLSLCLFSCSSFEPDFRMGQEQSKPTAKEIRFYCDHEEFLKETLRFGSYSNHATLPDLGLNYALQYLLKILYYLSNK